VQTVIDTATASVALQHPGEFTAFEATVPAGATVEQVRAALTAAGAGELEAPAGLAGAHVHVRTEWLRRTAAAAGVGPEWSAGLAGMLAHAASRGWTDEAAGTVRAHVVVVAGAPDASRWLTGRRRNLDPEVLGAGTFYRFMTATVVPRPIAWVSTRSAAGVDNLAPHSFFTVACVDPPVLQFTSVGRKDSLRNVEETGEFVVNLVSEPQFEQTNATGTAYPPDTGEYDAVGIAQEPSLRVAPPRVAASPAAFECVLHSTVRLGDSTVVFGRVVHAVVDTGVLDDDGHPRIDRLAPLARLGADEWSTVGRVREISRIPYDGRG